MSTYEWIKMIKDDSKAILVLKSVGVFVYVSLSGIILWNIIPLFYNFCKLF